MIHISLQSSNKLMHESTCNCPGANVLIWDTGKWEDQLAIFRHYAIAQRFRSSTAQQEILWCTLLFYQTYLECCLTAMIYRCKNVRVKQQRCYWAIMGVFWFWRRLTGSSLRAGLSRRKCRNKTSQPPMTWPIKDMLTNAIREFKMQMAAGELNRTEIVNHYLD